MSLEHRKTDAAATRSGPRRALDLALAFLHGNLIMLSVVAVLLLLYTLAGFFLVPRIARSQIEEYVTGTLHRRIVLGELRFNPFTFDASVSGLQLTESDGSPLVSFRHLYVNAELASVWQRAVVLKEVTLTAPDIQLIVARDGKVNLAQLAPESKEPAPAEESAPPRVRIGRLAVTQGRVGLEDRTRPRTFTAAVAPIRFTLTDFKTDTGYRNAYRFAGTTTAGEQLEWSGGFTVQPLGSSGQFRVQGLKLATIDAYLDGSMPFKLASGEALLKGDYQFNLNPLQLEITLPLVAVRDVSLAERDGDAAAPVKAQEVDLQHLMFSLDKRNIGLKRIDVRGAHVEVAREADGSISLSRLFADHRTPKTGAPAVDAPASSESQQHMTSPESGSNWNIHVDTLQLEGASVVAEDRSVSPAARFELAPIGITITGWSTDPIAKLQLAADITINKDGRLTTQGELQLEPLDTKLALELSNFALPVVQPYLAQATAMTLHSGKLSAKGNLSFAATPAAAPPLKFTGEVQVADLRTTDQRVREDFVKWRNLALTGISFEHNPDRLSIDRIVARQPYARVIIAKDRTLNVIQVLNPHAEVASDAAPSLTLPREAGEGKSRHRLRKASADAIQERVADATREPPADASREQPADAARELPADASRERSADATRELRADASREQPADGTRELRADASREQSADATRQLRADASRERKMRPSRRQPKASPPPHAGEGQGGGAQSAPTFPTRIRAIQIIDGTATFADYSIQPSFAAGILDLNGKVTGLSSNPASRAQVSLRGKVDRYAPVDITGEANLLAATKYTALAMNFRNMELTTFNPYSGKFAGYNISRGKLSTELKYKVEDRKLLAEHHIVVDNLEFGAKTDSKDAAPIPIKLAVALLKDRNGVIDVNLPVSGTLDDPKFRLGPIIWKAVLGLLTKIVTAPFAALGALFGGGDELAYVDFPAGSADLTAVETEKLQKLAKALTERPQLKLNVPLSVVSAEDSDALAQQALLQRVPDVATAPPDEAAQRKQIKTLEGLYKTLLKKPPEYPPAAKTDKGPNLDAQLAYLQQALRTQLKPDPSALDALGQQRARAVQAVLLANEQLSAERVFVTSEHSGAAANGGHVRMEMKLE
jgi:uncharacterized protein involved in outer membrane biogenesis